MSDQKSQSQQKREAELNKPKFSPQEASVNAQAKAGSDVKAQANAHEHNVQQREQAAREGLDTTPEAAKLAQAESKQRMADEIKEDPHGDVGLNTGTEVAEKVNTPIKRIVDQTEQAERAGRSASEPTVVHGFTLAEQGEVADRRELSGPLAGILAKMPLSSSERDTYEAYPMRALSAIRSFLNSRTDAELVELLSE